MQIEWQTWKTALEDHLHLSRDAMHVHASVLIFLIACLVLNARPRDWRPWLVVLTVQLVNEAFDARAMILDDGVIYIWASVKDTVNTMILPTIFLVVARTSDIFGSRDHNVSAIETADDQAAEESGG